MTKGPKSYRGIKRAVHARDGWRCRYCGRMTSWRLRDRSFSRTVDHVIPRIMGGRSNIINLVTCCKECNETKGDRTLGELGWKLRPIPPHRIDRGLWKHNRYITDVCTRCDKPARYHSRPPYHGGPRDCPNGETQYQALAHYIYLQSQNLLPLDEPVLT